MFLFRIILIRFQSQKKVVTSLVKHLATGFSSTSEPLLLPTQDKVTRGAVAQSRGALSYSRISGKNYPENKDPLLLFRSPAFRAVPSTSPSPTATPYPFF